MAAASLSQSEFLKRVLIVVAVAALALLLWRLVSVLLLIFGAVVFAVLLRALSEPLCRWTGLPPGAALAAVVVALVALLTGAGWLFGSEIRAQWAELGARAPAAWERARQQLEAFTAGERLLETMRGYEPSGGGLAARLAGLVTTAADAAINTILVVVGGLYLAAQPGLYRTGVQRLFPKGARARVETATAASGESLRLWLVGQVVSMTIVGVLVGVGLWIIGVPTPAALGLVAGLAEFVPLVGPVLGAVPALLMAAGTDLETMLWTLALFVGVQQLESNLITPIVQRRVVRVPPLVTLFAVVAFGVLFGPLGVILAAPLTVVVLVMVKTLYIHDVLGEPAELPGRDNGA